MGLSSAPKLLVLNSTGDILERTKTWTTKVSVDSP